MVMTGTPSSAAFLAQRKSSLPFRTHFQASLVMAYLFPTPITRLAWHEEQRARALAIHAAAAEGGKDNAAVAVGSDNAAVAGGGDSATSPGGAAGAARPASRGGRIGAAADPEPCREDGERAPRKRSSAPDFRIMEGISRAEELRMGFALTQASYKRARLQRTARTRPLTAREELQCQPPECAAPWSGSGAPLQAVAAPSARGRPNADPAQARRPRAKSGEPPAQAEAAPASAGQTWTPPQPMGREPTGGPSAQPGAPPARGPAPGAAEDGPAAVDA